MLYVDELDAFATILSEMSPDDKWMVAEARRSQSGESARVKMNVTAT